MSHCKRKVKLAVLYSRKPYSLACCIFFCDNCQHFGKCTAVGHKIICSIHTAKTNTLTQTQLGPLRESKDVELTSSGVSSCFFKPAHFVIMSSWHLLWTTQVHTERFEEQAKSLLRQHFTIRYFYYLTLTKMIKYCNKCIAQCQLMLLTPLTNVN